MADVEKVCGALLSAMEKQAKQALGEEDPTSFIDTLIPDYKEGGQTIQEWIDENLDVEDLNDEWVELYKSDDGDEKSDGVRIRLSVSFILALKKALMKHYMPGSDVERVFGGSVSFINTGAQGVEATRVVLTKNEGGEKKT